MAIHTRLSLPMTALALALAVAGAPRAWASGFQLRDQSGSGQGNAYAGISAGGSDISSMFFNPAAMARYQGNQLQLGFTHIMPTSTFSGGSASEGVPNASPAPGQPNPISGSTTTGNIASSATIPTVYAMYSVDSDLKIGLSVNVPFGLTTNYNPGWAGRFQAVRSQLETLDITPSVAYRMGSQWSVGVAFIARHASAELSQSLDLGDEAALALAQAGVSNPGVITSGPAGEGFVDVKGSSWAYGYKIGFLYEPTDTLRMGLGYTSEVRETLRGTATFTAPGGLNQGMAYLATLPANSGVNTQAAISNLGNTFKEDTTNGGVSAVVKLPSTISLGAIWDVSTTCSLAAEVSRTHWALFNQLQVNFDNANQPSSTTTEGWKDAMYYALGATCHPGNAWTYRLGVALDETPVPDCNRTPRIPDANRFWLSGGLSYQFTKAFGMDIGYSHLFCQTSTVNLQAGSPAVPDTFFRGNLSGTYKNSIDILSLQGRYVF